MNAWIDATITDIHGPSGSPLFAIAENGTPYVWTAGQAINADVHHDGSYWIYPAGPIAANGDYWTK